MRAIRTLLVLAIAVSWIMTGCIVVGQHEWRVNLNKDGTGSGTLIFHNLACDESEPDSVKFAFTQLIRDYLNGDELNETYPNLNIKKKELFLETFDGSEVVSGRIEFTFDEIGDVGLYVYEPKDIMLYGIEGENSFISANGVFAGEDGGPNIVIWEKGMDNVEFAVSENPSIEAGYVEIYKDWKANGESALFTQEEMDNIGE